MDSLLNGNGNGILVTQIVEGAHNTVVGSTLSSAVAGTTIVGKCDISSLGISGLSAVRRRALDQLGVESAADVAVGAGLLKVVHLPLQIVRDLVVQAVVVVGKNDVEVLLALRSTGSAAVIVVQVLASSTHSRDVPAVNLESELVSLAGTLGHCNSDAGGKA